MRTSNAVLVDKNMLLNRKLDYKQQLLYIILQSKTDSCGTTASVSELSRLSGFCCTTVRRVIQSLNASGMITPIQAVGIQNNYVLHQPSPKKKTACISVPLEVLYNLTLRPIQKMLYIFLLLHQRIGRTDACYPGYTTLASLMRVSKRTVQRASKALQNAGAIVTTLIKEQGNYPYLLYTLQQVQGEVAETKEQVLAKRVSNIISDIFQRDEKKKVCDGIGSSCADKNKAKKSLYDYGSNYNSTQHSSQEILAKIKKQIDYESLYSPPHVVCTKGLADEIVSLIAGELQQTGPCSISGRVVEREEIVSQFLKLDNDCIVYAIRQYQSVQTHIRNPHNYMRTVLFNSVNQINMKTENEVATGIW